MAEIGVWAAPLAYVVRDGVVESVHHGHLVGLDGTGTQALAAGDPDVAAYWSASSRPPSSLVQNCSGKHAAMLATCRAAGWDPQTYRDPGHPLQRAVRAAVEDLTGVLVSNATVDGCGAPLFSTTPAGLARAFARIATASPETPEGRVGTALRDHPWWVAGTGRDVVRLTAEVPGLIAKDGAEGVFAAALPDGRAAALKTLDGSRRPVRTVVVAALRALGGDEPGLLAAGHVAVLGHGVEVGRVEAALDGPTAG